jgi:hypothetical protein
MNENEHTPQSINICPEYFDMYAWDQDGECISITECWPDIPELADLHYKLGAWAETYERIQSGEQQFIELYDRNDMEGYYARGKVLANELARLLTPKGVSVSFCGELISSTGFVHP